MQASKNRNKIAPKRHYRLSFFNESQFREIWSIKLSRAKFFASIFLLAIGITGIFTLFLLLTPLRSILPGYIQPAQRHEIINYAITLDSIATINDINSRYLNNINNILTDNIDNTPISPIDSAYSHLSPDSIKYSSEKEKEFIKQFENREKYNLSVLSPIAAEGMTFYNPASGATPNTFTSPQLSFITQSTTPVSSTYRGTIISCTYSPTNGHTIIIQHPNNFISKYSGLNNIFVIQGDKVRAGSRLGLHINNSKNAIPLTFELWHNGTALNPTDYISF